ncbi:hypothetical protein OAP25_01125 [Flavobacteriaceae bacterium]|nr:hypothetical protein [Flavobacteriaceae bacterium]
MGKVTKEEVENAEAAYAAAEAACDVYDEATYAAAAWAACDALEKYTKLRQEFESDERRD